MRINTNLIISLTCSQQLKQIIRHTCSFGFWWHHNPEQHSHPHGCQNLKSYKHTNRLYFLNSYASIFFTFSCTLRLWNTELMLFLFLNTIWKWAVLLMFQKSLFSPLSRWNDFLLALANTYVQVHHLSVSKDQVWWLPLEDEDSKDLQNTDNTAYFHTQPSPRNRIKAWNHLWNTMLPILSDFH